MLAGLAAPLRADSSLPMFFTPVKKNDARYDTPAHAVIARISSLIHRDIEWYFETQTPETQKIQKKLYEEAGMDGARLRISIGRTKFGGVLGIEVSQENRDGSITRILPKILDSELEYLNQKELENVLSRLHVTIDSKLNEWGAQMV